MLNSHWCAKVYTVRSLTPHFPCRPRSPQSYSAKGWMGGGTHPAHIITTNDCDDGLFAVYIKPDPNSPLAACPYLTEGEALPPPLTRNRTPTQIVHLVVQSRSVAHSVGCDRSPGGGVLFDTLECAAGA